jgi:hypothetical protein
MALVVVRTSFTAAYLRSAAQFVHEAFVLETVAGDNRQEDLVDRHRGHVVGAIMLSVAALESELYELAHHGPGHHLGSGGTDGDAKAYLQPLASMIDEQSSLDRVAVLLHLLRKPPFETGKQPWQDARLVISLRNELVHYKSNWPGEIEKPKLFKALEELGFRPPPFSKDAYNFFPDRCLGAYCARWAVEAISEFIRALYERLGVVSPIQPFLEQLTFTDPDCTRRRGGHSR